MDAYKDERYSGLIGKGRWIKDQFADLSSEVNVFYEQARKGYVDRMQGVISGVADVIGAELTRAKQRIATGRDELQAEVKKLPADLQAIGKEAAGEFAGKFDELTQSVNDKGTQLGKHSRPGRWRAGVPPCRGGRRVGCSGWGSVSGWCGAVSYTHLTLPTTPYV